MIIFFYIINTVPLKCNFIRVHVYWLVHTHVQTCVPLRVMGHRRVSLTVHMCYMKGCTHAYAAQVDTQVRTRMLLACHLCVVDRALEG